MAGEGGVYVVGFILIILYLLLNVVILNGLSVLSSDLGVVLGTAGVPLG